MEFSCGKWRQEASNHILAWQPPNWWQSWRKATVWKSLLDVRMQCIRWWRIAGTQTQAFDPLLTSWWNDWKRCLSLLSVADMWSGILQQQELYSSASSILPWNYLAQQFFFYLCSNSRLRSNVFYNDVYPLWINGMYLVDICIENRMNASAFRDVWARVMFLKFSKLHEPGQFKKNITSDHISRNAGAIIRFFV